MPNFPRGETVHFSSLPPHTTGPSFVLVCDSSPASVPATGQVADSLPASPPAKTHSAARGQPKGGESTVRVLHEYGTKALALSRWSAVASLLPRAKIHPHRRRWEGGAPEISLNFLEDSRIRERRVRCYGVRGSDCLLHRLHPPGRISSRLVADSGF